jgi:hypothetical protein
MALTIAFIMIQMPFINRHLVDPDAADPVPDGANAKEAGADD